ncbi:cation diffusion facilitator family transporter [Roseinatronobacter alkalisoli]|uniref:Cation diffusion facilitator family transporter n=1 Tax=Roseinatronobacter alkalisoli TaxID=3028235 RepID=A0ABT5T3C4_9RHOB|nr:cation diffusion facilitator family transporter [Roseinatronobacter sp. HJB301]MDD7969611.1 cation diffusion facilitator family transporter [Roseinatronobacter sp. HJB301]
MTNPLQTRAKTRVTLAGAAINLVLSILKIIAGFALASPALVADGFHSLGDMASDIMVLWALRHSARAPDADHPYGHGRFETLATLALAAVLVLTGVGVIWDAAGRLAGGPDIAPGALALVVVAVSILIKEGLFHYTLRVGRATGSALLEANAWHHRTDALSSVVALVGIGAAQFGFGWADPLAAIIIALMLLHAGWGFGKTAAAELVDTQAPDDLRTTLEGNLNATPGVQGLRDLRMRKHGAQTLADVSVMVDPQISVTEGHRIAEVARARALDEIDALSDLVIHVEPAGHFEGFGAEAAPLRAEVEGMILTLAKAHPMIVTLESLRLGYFDDGLHVELLADLRPDADPVRTESQLAETLTDALPEVVVLRLHRISTVLRD